MTDPLASLNLILERASAERDNALAALRQAEAARAAAEQQAAQLDDYRAQYRQRWNERFRAGEHALLVQYHQDFGRRLDQAITLQHDAIAKAQARVRSAREEVVMHEQRVASVRKLIERRTLEIGRVAARREQRQTDEAAQRSYRERDLSPPIA